MPAVKVLIVDHRELLRDGLSMMLAEELSVCAAGTPAEALARFQTDPQDVVLLDLDIPVDGGMRLLEQLLTAHPEARVLVYSLKQDARKLLLAIERGARGYLARNDGGAELLSAIRQVASGSHVLPGDSGSRMVCAQCSRPFPEFRFGHLRPASH